MKVIGHRLADRAKYGQATAPHDPPFLPTRLRERCPECNRGTVVQSSDDPRAVRYVCSRHCGWDA